MGSRYYLMLRVRHWLLIVALIALGCGGRSSDDDDDGGTPFDASTTDVDADRVAPPPDEGVASIDVDAPFMVPDVSRDARDGGAVDARDGGVRDVAADARDAAPDRRDASIDVDDASVDAESDHLDAFLEGGADPGTPDVADVAPSDVAPDSGADVAADIATDAADGCAAACGLVALTIIPVNPSISPHTYRQFAAWGTYFDGTVRPLTSEVHWTSSNPELAVVSNAAGSRGLALAKITGSTIIGADLGGIASSTVLAIGTADPFILAIEPALPSLPQGTRLRLTTTLTFSDGSTQNGAHSATWISSDPLVASIDADGVATAVMPGATTISASLISMSASMLLTVSNATLVSLIVEPANAVVPVGVAKSLVATGHFSDSSTQDFTSEVTWSTSDVMRASVSNAPGTTGLLNALAPGAVTITAMMGAISGTAAIDVTAATLQSITISLPSQHLVLGMFVPPRATGHYSDGSTADLTWMVTWSSLDEQVVRVGGGGLSAENEGATSITASFGGVARSLGVDVRMVQLTSIDLSPLLPALAVGTSVSVQATGHYADGTTYDLTEIAGWQTSAPSVVAIANAVGRRGVVTGLVPGTANITAVYMGTAATTAATVSP
jgi:hypothetical protein